MEGHKKSGVLLLKILITGGTGFVGREIVRAFRSDDISVRVLSRRHPENVDAPDGVEVFEGDLSDIPSFVDAIDGVDLLIHAGEIRNTTRGAARRNLEAVEALVNRAEKTNVRRLVFVSSITVAGIPARIPAVEDTPPSVTLEDHYTGYKRAAESFLKARKRGLETVIVRPAPVYGTGSRVLPEMLRLLRKIGSLGVPFPGNGENLVPLVHARDLGRAIMLAGLRPEAAGQIFNLTDGVKHRWRDLLETALGLKDRRLRLLPLPIFLLKPPAFIADLFTYPFGISGDLASYVDYFSRDIFFENRKARERLGWTPEVNLNEGIREMIEEIRNN